MSTVTVVVVCYNHSQFVRECLDSVRTQTRPADQVLIVDDASPDNSAEVIAAYLAEHPGFAEFFPNRQNVGLNQNLNAMLDHVTSELYTVLAADDYLRADRLAVQVDLLDSSAAVLAYSDAVVVDADSQILEQSSRVEFPWPDEPGRTDDTFAQLLAGNWIPAASIVLRTQAVRDSGGYPDLLFEDYELLVRLAREHRFAYSEQGLVHVRRLPTSMMMTVLNRDNPRYLLTMDALLAHYEGAAEALQTTARGRRWELAKQAARISMPRRDVAKMMLGSRRGARSPLTFLAHLARALLAPRSRSGR